MRLVTYADRARRPRQGYRLWRLYHLRLPPLRLALRAPHLSPRSGGADGRQAGCPSSPSRSGGEVSRAKPETERGTCHMRLLSPKGAGEPPGSCPGELCGGNATPTPTPPHKGEGGETWQLSNLPVEGRSAPGGLAFNGSAVASLPPPLPLPTRGRETATSSPDRRLA